MLLELVKLGPLDAYLRNNSQNVKSIDLVEAAACLATAVWHLVIKFFIINVKNYFTTYYIFFNLIYIGRARSSSWKYQV